MNISISKSRNGFRILSYVYLLTVPVLVSILAFSVGHVGVRYYLPLWLLVTFLMFLASRQLAKTAPLIFRRPLWLLVIPWMLIAIFGGMGPPPNTEVGWAALAAEQLVRFTFLIVCSLLVTFGFLFLDKILAGTAGNKFSRYGSLMIRVSLPLFILNSAYWGYLITYILVTYPKTRVRAMPQWLKTVSEVVTAIRITEIELIYLATAALALALNAAGRLSKKACYVYVLFACLAAVFELLPDSVPMPLAIPIYLSGIPAYTLLLPYLIAVNIWYKQENSSD